MKYSIKHRLYEAKTIGGDDTSASDPLLQEGLLDFIKNLFGAFVKAFTNAAKNGTVQFENEMKEQFTDSELQKIAKQYGLKGLGEPGEFKYYDLDFSDKKHRLVFFHCFLETWEENCKEDLEILENALKIENWMPKDDSEEAAKEWHKVNGEIVSDFWEVCGWHMGMLSGKLPLDKLPGCDKAYAALETAIKNANPGEAVQASLAALEWFDKVCEQGVKDGSDHAKKIIQLTASVVTKLKEVGKAIAESGKEAQNESRNLKYSLKNSLIYEGLRFDENLMIITHPKTNWYILAIDDEYNESSLDKHKFYDDCVVAAIQVRKPEHNCNGAVEIKYAGAIEGYGPTLYDSVMELTDGIINDRGSVSTDAYKVMQRYKDTRPDVEKSLLDNIEDPMRYPMTPDESDDCTPGDSELYRDGIRWPGQNRQYEDDPLSYSYNKPLSGLVQSWKAAGDAFVQRYEKTADLFYTDIRAWGKKMFTQSQL